ncbi:MAG: hypothetical protein NZ938_06945 [Aigarchaeota archaeon]|nr:hypothetical protein [Candidatus Calditenuaceae archaeon]
MSAEDKTKGVLREYEERFRSRITQLIDEIERDSWSVLNKVLSGSKKEKE